MSCSLLNDYPVCLSSPSACLLSHLLCSLVLTPLALIFLLVASSDATDCDQACILDLECYCPPDTSTTINEASNHKRGSKRDWWHNDSWLGTCSGDNVGAICGILVEEWGEGFKEGVVMKEVLCPMVSQDFVAQAATDVLEVSKKLESKQLLQRWKKLYCSITHLESKQLYVQECEQRCER